MKLKLLNSYFAFRHGSSVANAEKIIVSHPDKGKSSKFGLTNEGKDQVIQAVNNALTANTFGNPQKILIAYSPFSRTQESARITAKALGKLAVPTELIMMDELRERFFGDFDEGSSDQYQTIWNMDRTDSTQTIHSVESANSVLKRIEDTIEKIERDYWLRIR